MARIYAYATDSGEPLGEWEAAGEVEVAFAGWGFDAGSVGAPRSSAWLDDGRLRPGGKGVSLRVDATGDGVPEVVLGEVDSLQAASGDTGGASLRLTGPAARLSDLTVAGGVERDVTGAALMTDVLRGHPGDHRIVMGRMAPGRAAPIRLEGQSIWDLLTGLESDRGETFRLTALEDGLGWRLDLGDGLEDVTDSVVFEGGKSGGWSLDIAFRRTPMDLSMVGFSARMPADKILARTIPGSVLAALSPYLPDIAGSPLPRQLAGQGPVILRPDLVSGRAVELALAAAAARLPAPSLGELDVHDRTLWSKIRANTLITIMIPDEPTGGFERGIARVLATSYKLGADSGMRAAIEAWPLKGL